MLKNYFSYSLSNAQRELNPNQFYMATEFTIHFGNDERGFKEKGTFLFPKNYKAIDKKILIDEVIEELDRKRLLRNKKARIRRREVVSKKSRFDKLKNLSRAKQIEWILKNLFPSQLELINSGQFNPDDFKIKGIDFIEGMLKIKVRRNLEFFTDKKSNRAREAVEVFQSYLFFEKEHEVKLLENEDFLKKLISDRSQSLIKDTIRIKGMDRYIFKLYTPQYNIDGDLFLGKENKYSFGFSLERSNARTKSGLNSLVDNTMDVFLGDDRSSAKTYLSRKFMSKITISGIMLEKLVKEL